MLTWKIHPPERSSMTVDDRGNMVDSSDIDLSPFLSVSVAAVTSRGT